MITVGIDAGAEFTKVVVLKENCVVGRALTRTGGAGRDEHAKEAFAEALREAGIVEADVDKIYATGIGKYDVSAAQKQPSDTVALTEAAKYLDPEVTTVVDFGANEIVVTVLEDDGTIAEVNYNQQCSSGLGIFLRSFARRLGLSLEEMAAVPVGGDEIEVSDGCVPFAEMGALSMLNHGKSVEETAAAVTKAVAVRAATALNDITIANNKKVLYGGGLAKNKAFLDALYQRYGLEYTVAEDPEYLGALGAALLAAKQEAV